MALYINNLDIKVIAEFISYNVLNNLSKNPYINLKDKGKKIFVPVPDTDNLEEEILEEDNYLDLYKKKLSEASNSLKNINLNVKINEKINVDKKVLTLSLWDIFNYCLINEFKIKDMIRPFGCSDLYKDIYLNGNVNINNYKDENIKSFIKTVTNKNFNSKSLILNIFEKFYLPNKIDYNKTKALNLFNNIKSIIEKNYI